MAPSLALPWEGSRVASAASIVQQPALPQGRQPRWWWTLLLLQPPCFFALFPIARTAGWANIGTMKDHIEAHLSGNPCGEVPPEWLRTDACTRCWVCGLSSSVRGTSHLPMQPGPRQKPLSRRAPRRTDEERRELAVGLAREGFDVKECAALLAEEFCAEVPASVVALQSLHPKQASVTAHEHPLAPELS